MLDASVPAGPHPYITATGADHLYRSGRPNAKVVPVRKHMVQYFPKAEMDCATGAERATSGENL